MTFLQRLFVAMIITLTVLFLVISGYLPSKFQDEDDKRCYSYSVGVCGRSKNEVLKSTALNLKV